MGVLNESRVAVASKSWRGDYAQKDVLVQAARIKPAETVLDLGWEGRNVLDGRFDAESIFLTSDVREYRRFIADCSADAENRARIATDVPRTRHGYDVVLYRPTVWSAKGRVFELIGQAFEAMGVGARFLLAGRRKSGVDSYSGRMAQVFGNCEIRQRKGGLRVYSALKTKMEAGVGTEREITRFQYENDGGEILNFVVWPGVFSRDGLDPGTAILLKHLVVKPADRILDLGCGCGILGMVGAWKACDGEAVLLDADLLSIECAKENVKRSHLNNVDVRLSDGVEAVGGEEFDLVVCNPPTHEGNEVAQQFVEAAARHLSPGGRFVVVVKRQGPFRNHMTRLFAEVTESKRQKGYRILSASLKAKN